MDTLEDYDRCYGWLNVWDDRARRIRKAVGKFCRMYLSCFACTPTFFLSFSSLALVSSLNGTALLAIALDCNNRLLSLLPFFPQDCCKQHGLVQLNQFCYSPSHSHPLGNSASSYDGKVTIIYKLILYLRTIWVCYKKHLIFSGTIMAAILESGWYRWKSLLFWVECGGQLSANCEVVITACKVIVDTYEHFVCRKLVNFENWIRSSTCIMRTTL